MAHIFHPLRVLRDSLQQIGTAVNASREYNRAGKPADNGHSVDAASIGIPL